MPGIELYLPVSVGWRVLSAFVFSRRTSIFYVFFPRAVEFFLEAVYCWTVFLRSGCLWWLGVGVLVLDRQIWGTFIFII